MKAIGFLGGQVGDLVMCSVAAREFKVYYPDSYLVFAAVPRYAHVLDLFHGLGYIDGFHVWSSNAVWPTPQDVAYAEKQAFNTVYNPFSRHMCPDWYNYRHYVEETCMMVGLGDRLWTSTQCELGYRSPVIPRSQNTITFSLYASGDQLSKSPAPHVIREIIAWVRDQGFRPVFLGSNDQAIPGADRPVLSLTRAVDELVGAKLHVTIDTAFSWIASAYQVPVVGLYAINYPDMPLTRVISHNPTNPNAIYLNKVSMRDLTSDEIITSIEQQLSRS